MHPSHLQPEANESTVMSGPHRTRQRCFGPVCNRPSASWSAPSRQNRLQRWLEAVLTGRNGPGHARTVTNRAETALTGAVRTGLKPARWPIGCGGTFSALPATGHRPGPRQPPWIDSGSVVTNIRGGMMYGLRRRPAMATPWIDCVRSD